MEIERINENTVKFYISYIDIEERGFDREEIWYNRERGEELFWEMMEEVHNEDDFDHEGPLWIQIQALDKGLEVLVTKAQLSKDGNKLELPIPEEKYKDLPIDDKMEEFLEQQFQIRHHYDRSADDIEEIVLAFKDFEDLITLAAREKLEGVETKLYVYEETYFLYVKFPEDVFDGDYIADVLSLLLEYGFESGYTIHRLDEYGKKLINEDVLATLAQHFN
ncbi:adaptor protein MecA [Bacillus sp. FJAT-50079]|uniref:adaptor protein MecA n=1 Tax=Bacillus sp. FJAT-50079 TaxID=2833577 RepID=UPI001BC9EBB7|nr:adaptor protein MecA [Bacillus sp. FJAT-50079]MBS4207959.1 adaptor protein MecA [Bacillus sp. FJAT-50079]